jgi:hypothetical protein
MKSIIDDVDAIGDTTVTVCALHLRNGYVTTGHSASVSAAMKSIIDDVDAIGAHLKAIERAGVRLSLRRRKSLRVSSMGQTSS